MAWYGKLQYYSGFLPAHRFATLSSPLHKARTRKPFGKLTEEELNCFKELKQLLCNSRALSFPHWETLDEHPLILGLDFSQIAMGVSLSQDQLDPEDGTYKERVIAVRGRTNRGPSCNYSPPRGELSALMFGLETYGHLLISHQFVVRTDSMSVKHLNTLKTIAGVYARNAEVLARYDMILVHRPGKLHYLEDAVSRIANMLVYHPSPSFT